MILKLQQREKAGEIDLRYFDGTGFSLEPCVPYDAWQGIGETLRIPSSRSNRLNDRTDRIYSILIVIEGKFDTSVIIACFNQFANHIQKKTFVLLDNAPIHTSREFIQHIPSRAKKNLIYEIFATLLPRTQSY
ncbi:MAG: transposase [Candidatus Jettenia sp.]|nr:transposase [Candidatus Jettenia sp.]